MTSKIIQLVSIKKSFQLFWEELVVFEEINLEINRNELVLIYGPSGSGKTTLLNIITGLLKPTEGEVIIGDIDINLIPEKDRSDFRAKYFGIVFQDNNLISTLTAKENLLMIQELVGGIEKSDEKKVDELLKRLGTYKRSNSFPTQLSGGEKKRVAIARALVNDPYILILDEPTGNLDQQTAQEICELIKDLFLSTDMTIVISSHDPKVREIATKIYKVENNETKLEESYPEREKNDDVKYRPIKSVELERGLSEEEKDELFWEELGESKIEELIAKDESEE